MTALIAIVLGFVMTRAAQAADVVKFYWCAQVSSGTRAEPKYSLPGEEVLHLKAGDGIQFFFSPATKSYAYLLHVRPDRTITQLLPKPGTTAAVEPGADRYLPGPDRDQWFVLDRQVGREQVILLVAARRLDGLDAALRANASATGGARPAAARLVIDEVARLRAQHPVVPASARPETIAGTFRGSAVDPAAHATEVTASTLFVRSYIIEHK